METPKLPPDFDWVTERSQCSPLRMFEELKLQAKKDVDTFNALPRTERAGPAEFADIGDSFSVARLTVGGNIAGVRFYLKQGEISVESQRTAGQPFTATLTLTDAGECRLQIGTLKLDRWQFLRRALEPLFFGSLGS